MAHGQVTVRNLSPHSPVAKGSDPWYIVRVSL